MNRTIFALAAAACFAATPDAVFRKATNQIAVNAYGTGTPGTLNAPNPPADPVTGGSVSLSGDPATIQDSNGNIYVLVRDATGKFWFNRYSPTLGWFNWIWTGGTGVGKAALAFGADKAVYFAIRDSNNRYWMGRRTDLGAIRGMVSSGTEPVPDRSGDGGPRRQRRHVPRRRRSKQSLPNLLLSQCKLPVEYLDGLGGVRRHLAIRYARARTRRRRPSLFSVPLAVGWLLLAGHDLDVQVQYSVRRTGMVHWPDKPRAHDWHAVCRGEPLGQSGVRFGKAPV